MEKEEGRRGLTGGEVDDDEVGGVPSAGVGRNARLAAAASSSHILQIETKREEEEGYHISDRSRRVSISSIK